MISVELALRFRLLNISPDYQAAFEWLISTTLSYRLRLRHFYKNQMATQNYKEVVYIQKVETNERTEPPWRCGSHLLGCTWCTVKEDKHLTWKKWEDQAQASDGLARWVLKSVRAAHPGWPRPHPRPRLHSKGCFQMREVPHSPVSVTHHCLTFAFYFLGCGTLYT